MDGTAALTAGGARAVVASVAEDVTDIGADAVSADPLRFPGYRERLERARERTGETESVVAVEGSVGGRRATIVAFDFRFLGGSMGEATGDRIVAAFAHARARGQPLVSLVASGGARMQEGMRSLIQMQRLAGATADARAAGVRHVCVVRNPTTGGVWASLASLADVVLAVEGAAVSFAGARVRGGADDAPAFHAAGKVAAGFVDAEIPGSDVPGVLARWLAVLGDAGRPPAPCPLPTLGGARDTATTGWAAVERARSRSRPRAAAYLDAYCDDRRAISGDRVGGVDPSMLCGFGRRDDAAFAYVAQTGTANTPAGFRTATRLLRMAERLRLPVLTLIDTPGALNTAVAEQEGIGTAIGETFVAISELSVPITSVVIGEGGSGGALALAAPGRLWATPDSYFSVIAPEGAAAILYRDPDRAPEAAEHLRLGPRDLVELGVVSGVVGE